jgi:hypothetical protein
MVDALFQAAEKRGWGIVDHVYYLTNSDATLQFSCGLDAPTMGRVEGFKGDKHYWNPAFGFMASNTGRKRLCFYSGLLQEVSRKGFVTSKWIGERYYTGFNAYEVMDQALTKLEQVDYPATLNGASNDGWMRSMMLSEQEAEELLLYMSRFHHFTWGRIGKVLKALGYIGKDRRGRDTLIPFRLLREFAKITELSSPSVRMEQQYEFIKVIRQQLGIF